MPGWKDQLERIRRYYSRFGKIDGGTDHKAPTDEYLDDVLAFFQNCYHLKDHIMNDPLFPEEYRAKVEQLVTGNVSLAICADLCNGTKHFVLKKKLRSGFEPRILGSQIELRFEEGVPTQAAQLRPQIKVHYEIEWGEQRLDAFEIASQAMEVWEQFVIGVYSTAKSTNLS